MRELTVLAVEADTRPQIVHNLEIANAHTYFAGELEAWGHNKTLKEWVKLGFEGCASGLTIVVSIFTIGSSDPGKVAGRQPRDPTHTEAPDRRRTQNQQCDRGGKKR